MSKILMSLALSLLAALLFATTALAGDPTSLGFRGASPTRQAGQLVLKATLADAAGKPLGDREVVFYQHLEFFGARDALIGSATTESEGTATLSYQPAQMGEQTIVAHFAGDKTYAEASASGPIHVTEAARPFEAAPLPLALVSRWLPYVLGAFVLATWVALLGVFLSATAGIKGAVAAPLLDRAVVAARPASQASRR